MGRFYIHGDYKRQVKSGVDTTTRLEGKCAYGTAMMIPFLDDNGETLAMYFAMTPAQQAPCDILYKDMIVTVIMLKNCGYETLRTFLSQQFMSPAAQAYPTVSNALVDMLNSGNFTPDSFKAVNAKNKNRNRNKNKNKNKEDKEDEVVGAIVEPEEPSPVPQVTVLILVMMMIQLMMIHVTMIQLWKPMKKNQLMIQFRKRKTSTLLMMMMMNRNTYVVCLP